VLVVTREYSAGRNRSRSGSGRRHGHEPWERIGTASRNEPETADMRKPPLTTFVLVRGGFNR
jgi:hypothetical protein